MGEFYRVRLASKLIVLVRMVIMFMLIRLRLSLPFELRGYNCGVLFVIRVGIAEKAPFCSFVVWMGPGIGWTSPLSNKNIISRLKVKSELL